MAKYSKLGNLACGQEATVAGINGTGTVMMRLMEIGLIPGRTVSVLRRAPFGGPVELLIDKTRLAVRTCEADCVEIIAAGSSAITADVAVAVQAEPVAAV